MVGYAFMGAAHSQAWHTAGRVFDLPLTPLMVALCGRDAAAAGRAAATLGWQSSVSGWEELVERPDIDVIDICTPGDTHAQIAIAALDAGKHVPCEKPPRRHRLPLGPLDRNPSRPSRRHACRHWWADLTDTRNRHATLRAGTRNSNRVSAYGLKCTGAYG
jgi:hypothetical protein